MKGLEITDAAVGDAATLTDISFAAKRVWNYPEEYFRVWENELTITEDYICSHRVRICRLARRPVAYYSLVELAQPLLVAGTELSAGSWLDHMFVQPLLLGQGVGAAMMADLLKWGKERNLLTIQTLADPNAVGFYHRFGWQYLGEVPSTIAGRTTPHLRYYW